MSSAETVSPLPEIVDEIRRAGGDPFRYCWQCATCDVVCPWNRVVNFSMRKLVWQATLGLPDIERDDLWRCTTCGKCPSRCPRGVDQIAVSVALRRVATAYGAFPDSVRPVRGVASSLLADGNPLSQPREKRGAWTDGLGVKPFAEGMEILWFVGCYGSYDPRMQKVARATAAILAKAGVDFGILGPGENCCGESIRKAGNEEVFKTLARANIKAFIDHGVKRVLVSSPHCYHTFRNEYPEFMVHFEVVHIAELLAELIATGRLKLAGEVRRRVTYHDPCYLGRRSGVYDAPRNVLSKVPGLELVEMPDNREQSLCCGGGGGRIWMETPKGERLCDLRLGQAQGVRADVLATSCPYCISNFEESALSLPEGQAPAIRDVTEIVLESLGGLSP